MNGAGDAGFILGFDTSCYTTSVAAVSEAGDILADARSPLPVPPGARGLRQSEAFFRHTEALPALVERVMADCAGRRVVAVAASERPRAADGSYMPVFAAGLRVGRAVAAALGVPLLGFSHQAGHLAAGAHGTPLTGVTPLTAWHLSGGTSELLRVEAGEARVVGGSRDLSFGQLIDRVGVAMGLGFPAGAEADARAEAEARDEDAERPVLPIIHTDGCYCNLSGLETHCLRRVADAGGAPPGLLAALFGRIADCVETMSARAETDGRVLMTGGVAASRFLRKRLSPRPDAPDGPAFVFGSPRLSSDNAVGVALLGAAARREEAGAGEMT